MLTHLMHGRRMKRANGNKENERQKHYMRKTKMGCVSQEYSDQPYYQLRLIRVSIVYTKKAWVLSFPLSSQLILCLDREDAHDYQSFFSRRTLILFVLPCYGSCVNRTYIHTYASKNTINEAKYFSVSAIWCLNKKGHSVLPSCF